MTLKGGTSQACAACKYQRRRCLPECQLAPYFPADQPKMFQNAHRLFGVSNILKIIKDLDPRLQPEAMRSIIYESDVRNKSPVLGCYGLICELQYQVRLAEEELHMVKSQIAMCKMQQCDNIIDDGYIENSTALLQLGMGPPAANNDNIGNDQNVNAVTGNDGLVGNDQFWGEQGCDFIVNVEIQQQNQIQMCNLKDNVDVVHQFEGKHIFLDGIDDRQSFTVNGYESSSSDSAGSMKVLESTDLKNAAARFSLTNIT